jgi:hypothetical protein
MDVKGTRSGSAVILCSFLQASQTQSTKLIAGGTGATILADGASFTALDANTAITVINVGTAAATATGVDFELAYTIEKA